jgi:hypothetical protein
LGHIAAIKSVAFGVVVALEGGDGLLLEEKEDLVASFCYHGIHI